MKFVFEIIASKWITQTSKLKFKGKLFFFFLHLLFHLIKKCQNNQSIQLNFLAQTEGRFCVVRKAGEVRRCEMCRAKRWRCHRSWQERCLQVDTEVWRPKAVFMSVEDENSHVCYELFNSSSWENHFLTHYLEGKYYFCDGKLHFSLIGDQ